MFYSGLEEVDGYGPVKEVLCQEEMLWGLGKASVRNSLDNRIILLERSGLQLEDLKCRGIHY